MRNLTTQEIEATAAAGALGFIGRAVMSEAARSSIYAAYAAIMASNEAANRASMQAMMTWAR